MRFHIHKNLNVVELIEQYRPKLIVEMGVLGGATTIQLLGMMWKYDYDLLSIDTSPEPPLPQLPIDLIDRYCYVTGVSYDKLSEFPNIDGLPEQFKKKIDMCIIDTDHNYEVLNKELIELEKHLSDKAIIIFHDTETFKEMNKAIDEFLERNKQFSIIRESKESNGAIAIGIV